LHWRSLKKWDRTKDEERETRIMSNSGNDNHPQAVTQLSAGLSQFTRNESLTDSSFLSSDDIWSRATKN
jgi:hypothetical protein